MMILRDKKIIEPKNFYINCKDLDDLIIESEEVALELVNRLSNVKKSKKVADFLSDYNYDYEDLTDI